MVNLISKWEQLRSPRIIVIGDLILDHYYWAVADRVSPEAPVLVLQTDRHEYRPGGAASVAFLLRGLGCDVSVFGAIGDDKEGCELVELLRQSGVCVEGVVIDPSRPTTVKTRILGRTSHRQPHQLMRLDHESRATISQDIRERLLQNVREYIESSDAILVSDYGKGVIERQLLELIFEMGAAVNKIVAVDPAKGIPFDRYRGAGIVTPNRSEAAQAAGTTIREMIDATRAGLLLQKQLNIKQLVLKLDRDGLLVFDGEQAPEQVRTQPKNVCDVTGAGDMVLAALGLCMSSGWNLSDAAQVANIAAGLEVQEIGVAAITRQQISQELHQLCSATDTKRIRNSEKRCVSLDELNQLVYQYRREGKRIVFTNGCYDLLHFGHLTSFEQAATLGDILIVAVNSDASIRRLKGPSRPIVAEFERASLVAGLRCVDHVIVFDQDNPLELLKQIQPDVLVKGAPYAIPEVTGHDYVASYGGQVHVVAQLTQTSTTSIVKKIIKNHS